MVLSAIFNSVMYCKKNKNPSLFLLNEYEYVQCIASLLVQLKKKKTKGAFFSFRISYQMFKMG